MTSRGRIALVAQVDSTSHSDSLKANNCVDGVVVAYPRNGKLPKREGGPGADVRCRRSPLPSLTGNTEMRHSGH